VLFLQVPRSQRRKTRKWEKKKISLDLPASPTQTCKTQSVPLKTRECLGQLGMGEGCRREPRRRALAEETAGCLGPRSVRRQVPASAGGLDP